MEKCALGERTAQNDATCIFVKSGCVRCCDGLCSRNEVYMLRAWFMMRRGACETAIKARYDTLWTDPSHERECHRGQICVMRLNLACKLCCKRRMNLIRDWQERQRSHPILDQKPTIGMLFITTHAHNRITTPTTTNTINPRATSELLYKQNIYIYMYILRMSTKSVVATYMFFLNWLKPICLEYFVNACRVSNDRALDHQIWHWEICVWSKVKVLDNGFDKKIANVANEMMVGLELTLKRITYCIYLLFYCWTQYSKPLPNS